MRRCVKYCSRDWHCYNPPVQKNRSFGKISIIHNEHNVCKEKPGLMSCIQKTDDLICPDHARSKRSEDLSRVLQPTPVPKGGGFVSSALLIAHGRVLDLVLEKQTQNIALSEVSH